MADERALLQQYRKLTAAALPFVPEPLAAQGKLIWLQLEAQCDELGLERVTMRPALRAEGGES